MTLDRARRPDYPVLLDSIMAAILSIISGPAFEEAKFFQKRLFQKKLHLETNPIQRYPTIMTTVNVELFEALKKIDGVSEDLAKRAAEGDLSEIKSDIKFLKWGLAIDRSPSKPQAYEKTWGAAAGIGRSWTILTICSRSIYMPILPVILP